MKNILRKIIAPAISLLIAIPTTCFVSSCKSGHATITKIKLSSRYQYIYPGEELKIKATISPASASKDDLVWEIIDSDIPGFSISSSGKLFAPKTYTTNDPISVTIKASYKYNRDVYAIYSVLATNDKQHEFLGFAGGVSYLKRDGSIGVRNILCEETPYGDKTIRTYYLEGAYPFGPMEEQDGIDMYVGHADQFIDFAPIFKSGYDKGMKFYLDNYVSILSDAYNCLSWVTYRDGSTTSTIPKFSVSSAEYRKQAIRVEFTADEYSSLYVVCDAFQGSTEKTAAIFGYQANPLPDGSQGEEEHDVAYISDGVFQTQILCPTTVIAPKQKRVGDIYVYRKPLENVKTLVGKWVPNDGAPDIFVEGGEPKFTELEFGHHLPGFPLYDAAIVTMTYTVDPNKLTTLDYEDYHIGTYCVYDELDVEQTSPVAELLFRVSWVD